jgi:hypothetical protein
MGRAYRFVCGCEPPNEHWFGLAGEWPPFCHGCQAPWQMDDAIRPVRAPEGSHVEDVTITPEVAAEWLTLAQSVEGPNDPTKVDLYVRLLREGRWQDMTLDRGGDGCPIVFDGDGNLRFGMQRLEACVRAEVSFRAVVARWPAMAAANG